MREKIRTGVSRLENRLPPNGRNHLIGAILVDHTLLYLIEHSRTYVYLITLSRTFLYFLILYRTLSYFLVVSRICSYFRIISDIFPYFLLLPCTFSYFIILSHTLAYFIILARTFSNFFKVPFGDTSRLAKRYINLPNRASHARNWGGPHRSRPNASQTRFSSLENHQN